MKLNITIFLFLLLLISCKKEHSIPPSINPNENKVVRQTIVTDKMAKEVIIQFDSIQYNEIKIEGGDWISMSLDTTKNEIRLQLDENETSSERQGKILLKPNDNINYLKREYTIIQKFKFGRYRDSLALQSIAKTIEMKYPTGYTGLQKRNIWLGPISLDKLNPYGIFTEMIDGELRIVSISDDRSIFQDFYCTFTEDIKYLTELRSVILYSIVPSQISNLSGNLKLDSLLIYSPEYKGFYSDFEHLNSLKYLSVQTDKVKGSFTSEVSNLVNLENLDVMGGIDVLNESVFSLPNLKSFKFHATTPSIIPGYIKDAINLENLTLFGSFYGQLPQSIWDFNKLKYLHISAGQLSGTLANIGNLKNLEHLYLQLDISSSIPASIGDLKKLTNLGLSNCNLTGEIPKEFGLLKELVMLTLNSNKLEGEIPEEFSNLTKLYRLSMVDNKLSGNPLSIISKFRTLNSLHLSKNQFSGEIPNELQDINQIQYIDISENNFSGNFPDYFSKFDLIGLKINQNKFSGVFPKSIRLHHKFYTWNPTKNIFPQQEGFGFEEE
jgi:Leucine-rich repeat (LRR) protein